VASSLFGACFSAILIFRRPSTPHTRVATQRMLSAIRPPELSHGTAESCRIAENDACLKTRAGAPEYREHEDPTALRLNRLLEVPSINAGGTATRPIIERPDCGANPMKF
jgi:hypothetical protein